MKWVWVLIFVALISGGMQSGFSQSSSSEEITQALTKLDDLWRGSSSRANITLTIKAKNYERTLSMNMWSKGKDKTILKITDPAKDKGFSTLQSCSDVFNYLPRSNRLMRIGDWLQDGDWLGTLLSYSDLAKTRRFAEHYTATLVTKQKVQDEEIYRIELRPKPEISSLWSKVELSLKMPNAIPLQMIYFDQNNVAKKTLQFGEVRSLGGKALPTLIRISRADRPGEITEMLYNDLSFNMDLPDAFFVITQLKTP